VESVIGLGPLFVETQTVSRFLQDADGNLRAALACWGIAISALVILRVPRQVVLACLIVAAATVGLASLIIDIAPVRAGAASARPADSPASYRAMAPRSDVLDRNRPR